MPTPPPQPGDRATLARERLAAKRRRTSNLRRRVVAGALTSFALAWGVIAFNGPMGAESNATTTASTATTTSTPSSTSSTDSSSSDNSSSDSSSSDSSSSDNTVTTAQS
jgi:cytoskeletal protein RodZ